MEQTDKNIYPMWLSPREIKVTFHSKGFNLQYIDYECMLEIRFVNVFSKTQSLCSTMSCVKSKSKEHINSYIRVLLFQRQIWKRG